MGQEETPLEGHDNKVKNLFLEVSGVDYFCSTGSILKRLGYLGLTNRETNSGTHPYENNSTASIFHV